MGKLQTIVRKVIVKRKPRKVHKFRFQLLRRFLVKNYRPCRVADIGGGKGLLAYLLNKSGWRAVVIDPVEQELGYKYRDIETGKRVKLSREERASVLRINKCFEKEEVKNFDLLVGLHAHGANMRIIDACKRYGKDFALLPCCVIGEPIVKRPGVNWLESLVDYAVGLGFEVRRKRLNFVGQDTVVYSAGGGLRRDV